METAVEWLKHNDDPAQVRAEMRRTAWYRWNFIIPAKPGETGQSVTKILSKFPHLFESGMVSKSQ